MGSSEPSTQPSGGRPLVRSRAIDSLRTALETTPTLHSDVRMQQAGADTERPNPDKRRDIAVAMNLAREAVATAAKVADDELRNLRQLLEETEARAKAAEDRVILAEARAGESEQLLANIRDQIVANVVQRRAA
jgi:hypothetical protein